MTDFYFICGAVGSGKTTYARKLTHTVKGIRFSPDEWMIPLFGEHMERELFDHRFSTISDLFKRTATQCRSVSIPVIFDYGFWKRSDREEIIHWAESVGGSWEIHFLDTPFELCRERAVYRNMSDETGHFEMNDEMLDLFHGMFETPDETEKFVRITPTFNEQEIE